MGKSGCGKTTLTQWINGMDLDYNKTQAIEYVGEIIDTPGEYMENKSYYNALIVSSYDSDIVALVQDATDEMSIFPPQFISIFTKDAVGIITKIDHEKADIDRATMHLENAGCHTIVEVSAVCNIGMDSLQKVLNGNGGSDEKNSYNS